MKSLSNPKLTVSLIAAFFFSLFIQPLYAQEESAPPQTNAPQNSGFTVYNYNNFIMVECEENTSLTVNNFFEKLGSTLHIAAEDEFRLNNTGKDDLGFNWYRYDQFHKGVPVMCGQFMLFEKNGKIRFARGNYYKQQALNVKPKLTAAAAIEKAKTYTGAEKYLWENTAEEALLKKLSNRPDASYYPNPELLISPVNGDYAKGNFRLSYKINITAEKPAGSADIFVDAQNGEILNTISRVAFADTPAKATTFYSGTQKITTDYFNGNFRLQESAGRPLRTYNMLNGTNYTQAIDFSDLDNNWQYSASILNSLTIQTLNNSWQDFIEDRGANALPDLYMEITDANNNIIYSKADAYFEETALPVTFDLKNIRLLTGSTYTIKIYDHDWLSPDDLVGTFTFEKVFTSIPLEDNGTKIILNGSKGTSGALDAHWGIEKTYDYYKRLGRNSYDGQNSPVNLFVHPYKKVVGNGGNNAFWNGTEKRISFGDGDGVTNNSWTPLDICGHELTHGYIDYNASGGLLYERESGALNESFADIFGACVEAGQFPGPNNWTIGEKLYISPGGFLRSMQFPKTASPPQPNTYGGDDWLDPSVPACPTPHIFNNDFCYVHTNSGVQNRWFYLLVNGGSGKIDEDASRYDYKIPGIGIENAARIAYRNMMFLLPSNATYEKAYLMALQSATDNLFPNPSTEYRAVREAWFAVGVAKRPVIQSFTPQTGPVGTTVTITGQNFTGISYIGFNETFVPPSQFTVNSGFTQINVKVPTGATTGYISIVAGYDTVKSTQKFIVCGQMNISVSSSNATSFTVNVTGGTPPYLYSLDNANFQTSNVFTGLQPGQSYTVYVRDSAECTGQHTFFLSNPIQCNIQSGSGGQGTTFINQILGTNTGYVRITYQMFTIPDRMDVYYNNLLVATTGGLVSGTGTLIFYYIPEQGGPYSCVIKMSAPNPGTAWNFTAYCPTPTIRTTGYEISLNNKGNSSNDFSERYSIAVLYPNPASTYAHLTLKNVRESLLIKVVDVTGREVWEKTVLKDQVLTMPLSGWHKGMYFISIYGRSEKKQILKLIVQ